MAVQPLFYSDRDGLEMALKTPDSMLFTTKAEADARDKMLELSENIQLWLEKKSRRCLKNTQSSAPC